jgi:hypothetical protein
VTRGTGSKVCVFFSSATATQASLPRPLLMVLPGGKLLVHSCSLARSGRAYRRAPRAIALLLFDPEGRAPAGVSHMVVYGIPADVKGFAEGELSQPFEKFGLCG